MSDDAHWSVHKLADHTHWQANKDNVVWTPHLATYLANIEIELKQCSVNGKLDNIMYIHIDDKTSVILFEVYLLLQKKVESNITICDAFVTRVGGMFIFAVKKVVCAI